MSTSLVSRMKREPITKLMRRVLAAISNEMEIGDITTLANPDVVEQIRLAVQGPKKRVTRDGLEDIRRFGEIE